MGSLISTRQARILMLGLDNAGKTTILYQLKQNEAVMTIPTIGFNVETIKLDGLEVLVWDIGGQSKLRQLWHNYYKGADGVVFVIDSSDQERLELVKREVDRLMSEFELKDAVFLLLCNKEDKQGSLSCKEVARRLDASRWIGRKIKLFSTNALTGEGVVEGLMWLTGEVKQRVQEETVEGIGSFFKSMLGVRF